MRKLISAVFITALLCMSAPSVSEARGAVEVAQKYVGTNPTHRRTKWCAEFVNFIEKKVGRRGSGSAWAKSFLTYGKRVSQPQKDDIAVMNRGNPKGRNGHVGYFVGWAPNGKAIVISGNGKGSKVRIAEYPRSRIIEFRRPA
ncbi:hypothetical protein IZ6_25480 [Terrihabitans soli]|uniref:Peptidase C51 domain-containing protein n=1 Tax=Terrihabitans soli TaxID=708113 RepID=A0A6S6QKH9_9HYPH|nr:TIGR02594 family protein [Terrihabitans soli]BCJ91813.1 hypothetical protein IZ6_25480 [Terrihabitans soli]